jgi:hypothetical protein
LATPYVTTLYRDVLGRAPDSVGLSAWLSFLQAGGSREQVAQAFWESPEHRGLQVDALYAQYLHRAADAAGRAAWVNALRGGMSLDDVLALFLTSPEYASAHSDSASFVSGLYSDVLGRAGRAEEIGAWQAQLDGGLSRGAVVQAVQTSPESYLRDLNGYYARFLGRGPDTVGEQTLLAAMESGQSDDRIAEGFLASEEFFAKAFGQR